MSVGGLLSSGAMVLTAVVMVVGCGAGGASTAGTVNIPTLPSPSPGVEVLCASALHAPFTLEGAATASPAVWGVDIARHRFGIVWPPGFSARFSPGLEILDTSGAVVARQGTVSDAGGAGDDPFYVCSIDGKIY